MVLYTLAECHLNLSNLEESKNILNEIVNLTDDLDNNISNNIYQIIIFRQKTNMLLGAISLNLGEYNNSLKAYFYCENDLPKICKEPELNVKLSAVYLNIGLSYIYLGNKNIAEKYLKKALSQTEGILGNDVIHKLNADIFENLGVVYELMNAIDYMRKGKIGGLIVIEREISLNDYIEKSKTLAADISSDLLISIFFPRNPLHDGGVIIQGNKITSAGAVFPISLNGKINKKLGTRHRAALGISEESDCIALVVSEETGKISIAINGVLNYNLSIDDARMILIDELKPKKELLLDDGLIFDSDIKFSHVEENHSDVVDISGEEEEDIVEIVEITEAPEVVTDYYFDNMTVSDEYIQLINRSVVGTIHNHPNSPIIENFAYGIYLYLGRFLGKNTDAFEPDRKSIV